LTEHKTSVLIAEDEPGNREILRAIIKDILGYNALLVEDGQLALEAIRTYKPSLILMDLMMPVLDGFEAISLAKADRETANIPIIAVTALGRPTDHKRALDCGADDYLSKPFDLEELIAMVERMIG
jgi:CheY-like chemotaxis protein